MHNSPATQKYSVPVIPPDLRKEETIKQIADSLEYLEKVATDVFSRISNRVEDNHSRLRAVNDRVNLAQAKIDTLKGSHKATKVFSSAKYPAAEQIDEYGSVFSHQDKLNEVKRTSYKLQSKHQQVDDRVLKEKLQFYNVHLNLGKKEEENSGEGLGRLPRIIPSVSSLLLFNTSENP